MMKHLCIMGVCVLGSFGGVDIGREFTQKRAELPTLKEGLINPSSYALTKLRGCLDPKGKVPITKPEGILWESDAAISKALI